MITATDLSWSYGRQQVLDAVDLATRPGRVLGLIGPNGSGKTTLLRLLYGSLNTPQGTVRVDGTELRKLTPRQVAARLAVVVQESSADSALSVAENVLLGRTPHLSSFARIQPSDQQVVATVLSQVGAAHLAARQFTALSGGERQRVLIARALAQQASHLLLDEPTNHLDIRYQHEVLGLVAGLAADLDTTTVVVLHDLNLASHYCDDLVLLGAGGIQASGPVHEVLRPDLLEEVYGIGMERLDRDGRIHLLYNPIHAGRNASSGASEASRQSLRV